MATKTSTDPTTPSYYPSFKTALLLLDFHTMFIEHAAGPKGHAAASVAANTRKWAKSKGIEVIHCLIDVHAAPTRTCKDTQRFASVVSALQSDSGKEPASFRGDSDNELTFTRQPGHISALKSPGLLEHLQEKGIKSLVLTGLSTSGCVLRTSVTASDEEFVVTVLEDGCADAKEDLHDVLVKQVLNNRGYVYTSEDFRRGWDNGSLGN